MPEGTSLIRQKLTGDLQWYVGGQPVPAAGVAPKAAYYVQDSFGGVTSVIASSSPGTAISIDVPKLPERRVRIGDTWVLSEKLFRDVVTRDFATLTTSNMLVGLEWKGGYPCAKIRTTFSGTVKIPFSRMLTEPVSLTGERITFFAYETGKVVAYATRATAKTKVDENVVNSLTRMPAGGAGMGVSSPGYASPAFPSPQGFPGGEPPPGMVAPGLVGPGSGLGGMSSMQAPKVDLVIEVKQELEMVH